MLFKVEVIETLEESENTSESITINEKNVKYIVKSTPDIGKVYFKAVRAFKCQTVYYCERQFRPATEAQTKLWNHLGSDRGKKKGKHIHKFNNPNYSFREQAYNQKTRKDCNRKLKLSFQKKKQ